MNNKKQPPKVFYKKFVLKYFSIFIGNHPCWIIFLIKLQAFRWLINLRTAASEKCQVKFFIGLFEDCKIGVLINVSRRSQENVCTRVLFLINRVANQQLKPVFIQKELPALLSYPKFLTTTFLILNKLWEKSIVIWNANETSIRILSDLAGFLER